MSVFKIGINEEGNQANHQRQHQGILCPVKIAPTNAHPHIGLRGNDYQLKERIAVCEQAELDDNLENFLLFAVSRRCSSRLSRQL
jgi:hypothetical protein